MRKHYHSGARRGAQGLGRPLLAPPPPLEVRCHAPPPWGGHLLQRLQRWAKAIGIESDEDLAGFYTSAGEAEAAAKVKNWSDEEAHAWGMAWRQARQRAAHGASSMRLVGKATTSPTTSSLASTSSLTSTSSLAADHSGRGPPHAAPATVAADHPHTGQEERPSNPLQQKERSKKYAQTSTLRAIWERADAKGLHWHAGTMLERDVRWGYLARAGLRLSASALSKHVTTWACWEAWAAEQQAKGQDVDIFQPNPISVASFLDVEQRRGATLGRSRLESFVWLRRRIGLDVPVKDILLTDFVNLPESHVAKQAEVMSPAMFVNIVGFINKGQRAKTLEARLVLFWALACVRQKHLEISSLTEVTEQFLVGWCPEGKSRRHNKNGLFRLQARYLVERQSPELWEMVLNEENEHRRNVIDQVVQHALPESTNADEVSATVKAFISADLPNELIELLEKIVLHKSADFGKNKNLQNLLILTAIKADTSRVMDYLNRLGNYGGPEIAKIALGDPYHLYEEAFLIYKKCNLHAEAMETLLANVQDVRRAQGLPPDAETTRCGTSSARPS